MINIKKSGACEFFYKYGIKKSTFQKTLVNIIKEKISREFLAERVRRGIQIWRSNTAGMKDERPRGGSHLTSKNELRS